jgi:hypothetical protein
MISHTFGMTLLIPISFMILIPKRQNLQIVFSIPGATPTDYYIQISWSDKTTIKQEPSFWNRSSGWLSK